MADSIEKCISCLKPKHRSSGGFVTQLIDVCRCSDEQVQAGEQLDTLPLCKVCRKSINTRKTGSLTQWIFRPDFCQCEQPVPIDRLSGQAWEPEKHVFTLEEDDGEELPVNPDSFPIDRYQPKVKLGAGASGTVYLSRDRLLGKRVAVKLLHELTASQLIAFQEEARTTSRLHHPNIIQVLDFGPTDSGVPYMVLEYMDQAASLEQFITANGPIDLEMAATIFQKVCSALEHAHEHHVFHRDLKPSNMLLADTASGAFDVKLIDFGVAKVKYENQEPTIVQGRTIVGTPAYMPPELVNGADYNADSETYTLGCVLFEALTGRPPFIGATALETLSMHARYPAPTLSEAAGRSFPEALEQVVARCLAKDPGARYATLAELQDELQRIVEAQTAETEGARDGFDYDYDYGYSEGDLSELKEHIDLPLAPVPKKSVAPKLVFSVAFIVLLCGLFVSAEILHHSPGGKTAAAPKPRTNEEKAVPIGRLAADLNDHDHSVIVDQVKSNSAFKVDVTTQTWSAVERVRDIDLKILFDRHRDVIKQLRLAGGSIEGQVDLTDTGFGYISKMPLRLLDAQRSSIRDSGLKLISRIKTLKFIDLTDTTITDKGLAHLADTNLEDLNVANCLFLTDKATKTFSKMKRLKMLNLSTTEITDEALKDLAKLNLVELRMSNTAITDKGLQYLGENRTIKRLHLATTRTTIQGLRYLKGLPLDNIKLQSCKAIDDDCMTLIVKQWPNIEQVDIDSTKVTGSGLAELSKLPRLVVVTCAALNLSDKDVEPLVTHPRLISLNLSENKISDHSLKLASTMPNLSTMYLGRCSGITKDGVALLKAAGVDVVNAKFIGGTPVNEEALESLMAPASSPLAID